MDNNILSFASRLDRVCSHLGKVYDELTVLVCELKCSPEYQSAFFSKVKKELDELSKRLDEI